MSAPSFSSFPPSFASFPELEPEPGPSRKQDDPDKKKDMKRRDKDKERDSQRDKERRKDKERRRSRSRDKDRERERERERPSHRFKDKERSRAKDSEDNERKERKDRKDKHKSHKDQDKRHATKDHERDAQPRPLIDSDLKAHNDNYRLFYVDTKGDALNLHYGGLYAGDIPKYRLAYGGRRILGLSNSWTVYHRLGNVIEVGLKGAPKATSISSSSSRNFLALPSKQLLPSTSTSSKYQETPDGFIRISSRRKDKHRNPESTYRSITSPQSSSSSESEANSDDFNSSDDSDSGTSPTLPAHNQMLQQIESQITLDPSSIPSWLSLLNHSLSTIPLTSRNANKSRAEITLSILSRALSAHTSNTGNKYLRLRYMKAGEEIWESKKLVDEWEEALKKVKGTEIWMEWLEWRIRSCKSLEGAVTDVQRVYMAFGDDEKGELARLRVFWRMTIIYKDAGFTEKAMAMFQAQMELTYKIPESLSNQSLQVRLSELEEFWDSEHPRIGEEGAQGWSKWYTSEKPSLPELSDTTLTKSNLEESGGARQLDPYRQWAFVEHSQDISSLLPAKSTDEAAELDPYTSILFSDIRDFLFDVKYKKTRNELRLVLLEFLGLHIPGLGLSLSSEEEWELNWDDRWNSGYLTKQAHLDTIFPSEKDQKTPTVDAAAGVLVGREKEYANVFTMPVRNWGGGTVGCLDISVNGSKELRSLWSQVDVADVNMLVVRRMFSQMRMGNRDEKWDEFALAFECAVNLKGSLKLSKSLVSTAQDSLLHWASHAQLERMRGKLDDARKIYQTVLIGSKPTRSTLGASNLWWNWAEMEWLAGKDEEALNIILRSMDQENANSGVVILRTKRMLEGVIEETKVTDEVKAKQREAWVKLMALLELLTSQNVGSMLQIFDRYAGSTEMTKEGVLVASLVMLYRYGYVLRNPMPPTILRDRVSAALEQYPSNSLMLGLFLEGEKGQGVWGRVRAMQGDNGTEVGKVKDVARRVEEVWVAGWEKGRWKSEVERARSGLAGAVESERTRASPTIWRIYLEFEIRTGELQKAKKLLYRAIGECPLCKDLYLLAFGILRSAFAGHELDALADLMVERGLRLRKGLDEVVEGFDMQGVDEGDEEGDSEIEERASELRRLMPY